MVKKLFIVWSLGMAFLLLAITARPAYAVFDHLNATNTPNIPIGEWTLLSDVDPKEEFDNAFLSFFGEATLAGLYNNQDFLDLLEASSTTGNFNGGATYSIENVLIDSIRFDVTGIYERASRTSLGFLRPIDRTLENGTPIYGLKGALPSSEADDPFSAYDVLNTVTDNNSSIRLDNEVIVTTHLPVANLTAIEFYEIMGLIEDNNDGTEPRTLTISIATDKAGPFETVASFTVTAYGVTYTGNPVSTAFTFRQFNLTTQQINDQPADGYYVRFVYDGGVRGRGNNITRSRVIIDDLTFITDND